MTRPTRPPLTDEQLAVRTNPEGEYANEVDDIPEDFEYGYPDEDEEPPPLPVYLVGVPPRDAPIIKAQLINYTVDANPIRIAGNDRKRRRLYVRVGVGSDNVSLSGYENGLFAHGFTLAASEDVEMYHTSEVWARCADTNSATLHVLIEYLVDDD